MQKTFWFGQWCLAGTMLLVAGCDGNQQDNETSTIQHRIPTADNLPSHLRSLSKNKSLQPQPQQPTTINPQAQETVPFDCSTLKYTSTECTGRCESDKDAKKCKKATISKTCSGKSLLDCKKVLHNQCTIDYRGTDGDGNSYELMCVDNQTAFSCGLAKKLNMETYCNTLWNDRGGPGNAAACTDAVNDQQVCNYVGPAVPKTCTLVTGICNVILARNAAGYKCNDFGIGSNPAEKHNVMCVLRGGAAYHGNANQYRVGICTAVNPDPCTQVWTNLAVQTEDSCRAIRVIADATGAGNAVVAAHSPMAGAPNPSFLRPLLNGRVCNYAGEACKPNPVWDTKNPCRELTKDKCGIDSNNTKGLCEWSPDFPIP
ncbi:MAG: hypothetical protein AAF320_04670 [Myxococcota bacterium]